MIKCIECNQEFVIKENYSFEDNELGILDIHQFYQLNKEYQKELLTDDYRIESKVKVKKFNFNDKKNNQEGYGTCYLTKEKLGFIGFVNHQEVEFEINVDSLKALPFSCGKEFECYYQDELYYFYPEDGRVCSKYAMIVDILNEA